MSDWNQISCTVCGCKFEEDDPMMKWSSNDGDPNAPVPFCSGTCYEFWARMQPGVGEDGEPSEGS